MTCLYILNIKRAISILVRTWRTLSRPHYSILKESEVFKLVKEINVSKSSGLDNISSFVVKEAFTALISEVTFMYNLSIQTSKFPAAWKVATITQIPKAGNPTLVQNYRPISLLQFPGKILEKLLHQQRESPF